MNRTAYAVQVPTADAIEPSAYDSAVSRNWRTIETCSSRATASRVMWSMPGQARVVPVSL